jgi:Tol biopolymer transport system component
MYVPSQLASKDMSRGTRPPRGQQVAVLAALSILLAGGLAWFLLRQPGDGRSSPSSSPSKQTSPTVGKIVFAGANGLIIMRGDGTALRQLTRNAGDEEPVWSPEGTRIAFVRSQAGQADIYSVRPNGKGLRRLTNDGRSSSPAWSPDGRTLAFVRETEGNSAIWVMNADGGGGQRLTTPPMLAFTPAWSADGTRIAFAAYTGFGPSGPLPVQIYVMELTGKPQQLTHEEENLAEPAWSPDGTMVMFQEGASIVLVNRDGSGAHAIPIDLPLAMSPVWSPEGTRMAFAGGQEGDRTQIYVMDIGGSGLKRLTHGKGAFATPDWHS